MVKRDIKRTHPCNIQPPFTAVKNDNFQINFQLKMKIVVLFLFLLKTLIVGTCKNRPSLRRL